MALISDTLNFNNHFLNQIIFHSIQNDEFLKKIRRIVPINIFKTRDKIFLIKTIFEYFDTYKKAPKENFFDLFKELEKTISDDLYEKCIDLIGILKDINGSNHNYILNTINDAIKHFKLEEASVEFASLIKRKKYDEAKEVILKAMKDPDIEQPYYDFFEDTSFILDRIENKQYKMTTQINSLDKIIGGFRESWLINILGATKTGKTWFFIEMAITAILQGLNVLFISLEMGKAQIDERFDMVIGFMTSKESGIATDIMKKVGEKWQVKKEDVDSIFEINKVLKNRKRMQKISSGNLKIMAFNRGRLNYLDVERIIDELEETEGFFTDIIIFDYLGISKEIHPGQTKKERISENCIGFKELAGKKNLIVISGMQGNRLAMKAPVFHSYLVADDIDTIFNSDLVLALCQTDIEETLNKYRIYVANYRHGKQHGSIGLIRDLNIGQMVLDTYDIKEDKEEKNEKDLDF